MRDRLVITEDVDVTCRAFPTQLEGVVSDGRRFYFRWRHGVAQLGLGWDHEAAVEATVFTTPQADGQQGAERRGYDYGDSPGEMAPEEALRLAQAMIDDLVRVDAELGDADRWVAQRLLEPESSMTRLQGRDS